MLTAGPLSFTIEAHLSLGGKSKLTTYEGTEDLLIKINKDYRLY